MGQNKNARIGLVRAAALGSFLFIVIAAAVVLPTIKTMSEGASFARDTRDLHLPALVDRQRSVLNVEKITHFLWVVSQSHSVEERRQARLAAQILAADASFEKNPKVFAKVSDAFGAIKRIEYLRQREDAENVSLAREVEAERNLALAGLADVSGTLNLAATASAEALTASIIQNSDRAILMFVVGAGLVGVMGVLAAYAARRHILAPILWSTQGLKAAGEGRAAQRAPPFLISELEDISMSVGEMARLLALSRETNCDLGGQVAARTRELECAKAELEKDIAVRKAAESALRESEALLRGLLGAWPDPTVICDREGTILYVNDAFTETYGFDREETLGKRMEEILPGEAEEKSRQEGLPSYRSFETVRSTKAGDPLTVRVKVAALHDSQGELTATMSIHRDVTHQLELERQLAQSQKMEAIGTLAGGIAHDFNNILSAIVGYTELALLSAKEKETREDMELVLQASNRAADLVRQILVFSRHTVQEAGAIRVMPIVKESLKLLRASIPSTVEFDTRILSDSNIVADPGEIHRIVVNLCTNASLSMRDTGGVLTVKLEDVWVDSELAARVEGLAPGRYVRLSVGDTGCGMEPSVLGRIFEPFYTTRADRGGTGLGLSVTQGVVKTRRGAIDVESKPGEGSTFRVYFPVESGEKADQAQTGTSAARGVERVLFVDDEHLIVRLAVKYLAQQGYQVTGCESSVRALELFTADPGAWDLVITDMTMPVMTGGALAVKLKTARPELPIILCTGYSETMSQEMAGELGIDRFISKPVEWAKLTRIMREVLDAAPRLPTPADLAAGERTLM